MAENLSFFDLSSSQSGKKADVRLVVFANKVNKYRSTVTIFLVSKYLKNS